MSQCGVARTVVAIEARLRQRVGFVNLTIVEVLLLAADFADDVAKHAADDFAAVASLRNVGHGEQEPSNEKHFSHAGPHRFGIVMREPNPG